MSEGSDNPFGEIPLGDLYDALTEIREEYPEYTLSTCRARIRYRSAYGGMVDVEGPVSHVPGGDRGWWLGVEDETRDRLVSLDLKHDSQGAERWVVKNVEGRHLGGVEEVEVGQDV